MKKLVLLVLVLGMASIASATISLQLGGADLNGTTKLIMPGETLTFDVADDSGIASGTLMYAIVEEGGDGALSNAVTLASAGNLGAAKPYTEAGWGAGYELATGSSNIPSDLVAGVQFNIDYVGGAAGDSCVISLWDGYGDFTASESAFTVEVVPEPMTLALLGIGGLFLRRRK